MYTPDYIINLIAEDAPDVYDRLIEESPENATPEQLLETLQAYEGDCYDVHWWYGRFVEMMAVNENIDRLQSHLGFELQTEYAKQNPEHAKTYEYAINLAIEFITGKA